MARWAASAALAWMTAAAPTTFELVQYDDRPPTLFHNATKAWCAQSSCCDAYTLLHAYATPPVGLPALWARVKALADRVDATSAAAVVWLDSDAFFVDRDWCPDFGAANASVSAIFSADPPPWRKPVNIGFFALKMDAVGRAIARALGALGQQLEPGQPGTVKHLDANGWKTEREHGLLERASPIFHRADGAPVPAAAGLAAPPGRRIPALTLSYGAAAVRRRMLLAYARLWPDHPFVFYVPFNASGAFDAPVWGRVNASYDAASLVAVPSPPGIRATMDALLGAAGCADGELIFWAPEDIQPWAVVDARGLAAVAARARREAAADPAYLGLALAYSDGMWSGYGRRGASERVWAFPGAPLLFVDHGEQFAGAPRTASARRRRASKLPQSNAFVWAPGFWRAELLRAIFLNPASRSSATSRRPSARSSRRVRERRRAARDARPRVREVTHRGQVAAAVLDEMRGLGADVGAEFLPAMAPTSTFAARVGALKRATARDELEAALVVEGTPPLDLARSFGFI
ncbi:cupin-like domain-containing protein [Aureococcus anophagefferens]|nr:cupin-like domain-containing protein [Aureococcus anophagefferens]